jgi:rubredoxin
MKRVRPRVEINLPELDQVLEQARQSPLSDPDYQKLKDTLHLLVGLLQPARSTEKTRAVLADGDASPATETATTEKPAPPGHGRNGVAAFTGARKIAIPHSSLQAGTGCPACEKGKVYRQKEPKPLLRIIGQAPLVATVSELERFRCHACGQVFTAIEPEEVG